MIENISPVEQSSIIQTEVQRPNDFFLDYLNTIKLAGEGDTVFAKAMMVTFSQHKTGLLSREWGMAAQRGAKVIIMPDSYGLRLINNGADLEKIEDPLERQYHLDQLQHQLREMKILTDQGVQIQFSNPLFNTASILNAAGISPKFNDPFPYQTTNDVQKNRNHMKGYGVVGKKISKFWMGGLNLVDSDFNQGDFMVLYKDPQVVVPLSHFFNDTFEGKDTASEIECGPNNKLYVDKGKRRESPILKRAISLIHDPGVARIQITSQFPIDPLMLSNLRASTTDGARVVIALSSRDHEFNTTHPIGRPVYMLNRTIELITPNLHIHHFPSGHLHSKLLLVTYKDGSKAAMFGSHNYNIMAVLYGTGEAQMLTTDQMLTDKLETQFDELIKEESEQNGTVTNYFSLPGKIPEI
jgi:hypothetical protein